MSKYRYVILGGGVTAGYAAREFVRKGVQSGDLCVVTREGRPPYDRPPLSKDVLQGEISLEDAAIETGAF